MMQMLLEISSSPVKYELEIQNAKLEYQQEFIPKAQVATTAPEVQIRTQPTQLRLDTYQARHSLGFRKVDDLIAANSERGKNAIAQYTRDTVEEGNQLAKIEDGVSIRQLVQQKMRAQPDLYTAFLPNTGADISWQPGSIQTETQRGSVNYDWQIQSNQLSYVPGSVRLKILERGSVEINYVGGPIYFPRSADPNYEEPAVG